MAESTIHNSTKAIMVFCAYIAFVLVGLAFYGMVDDSPFVPLMNSHFDLELAWLTVAGGSGLALVAIVTGGLPIGLSILRRGLTTARADLLLLAVPVLAFGVVLATFAIIWAITRGDTTASTGAPDVPVTVSATMAFVFAIVFVLSAIASVVAVSVAAARAEGSEQTFRAPGITITVQPFKFAALPALVATLAMALMLAGTVAWGLIARSNNASAFDTATAYQGLTYSATWLIVVSIMALSTLVAVIAVFRWFTFRNRA